jgi:hypothetical protein
VLQPQLGQAGVEVTGRIALSSAAHHAGLVWLSHGMRPAGHRGAEWLKRGLPSSKKRCPPRRFPVQEEQTGRFIIGIDPHKRSATIEVINEREKVLARARFGTDTDGYRTMLELGRKYPDRLWAVEGCNGIGRHIAQCLVAGGETVVDVPSNYRRGRGCSTPGRAAKPIRSTPTRWPWQRCVARVCVKPVARSAVCECGS